MEQENKLYVGNFPYSWSEADIEQVFDDYRDHIRDIKIVYDKFSGRSKGFAFVTLDDNNKANEALDKLSGSKAGDRNLVISIARPQRNFSDGQGGGGAPSPRRNNFGGGGGGGRGPRSGGSRNGGGRGGRDGGNFGGYRD